MVRVLLGSLGLVLRPWVGLASLGWSCVLGVGLIVLLVRVLLGVLGLVLRPWGWTDCFVGSGPIRMVFMLFDPLMAKVINFLDFAGECRFHFDGIFFRDIIYIMSVLSHFRPSAKVYVLFVLMFVFSIVYWTLDDVHFAGVNKYQEAVKDEVIKEKAKKELRENFVREQMSIHHGKEGFVGLFSYEPSVSGAAKEQQIDVATKEIKDVVEETELEADQVHPTLYQKLFNRIYFAVITGCLLGYGDIYPVTNTAKSLCMLQGLATVALIVS